jgi:hypothetical protein
MNALNWLATYVVDPVKTLAQKAVATGEQDLADLGKQVLASYTSGQPQGVGQEVVAILETDATALVDTFVTGLVGEIPVAGALLEPEAVALTNEGIAWAEKQAPILIAKAFAAARAQIAAKTAPVTLAA